MPRPFSFNRNIVECKDTEDNPVNTKAKGFNRNIVECKERFPRHPCRLRRSFNRNIVECKVRQGTRYASATLVLIETLWNVKKRWVMR